MKHAQIALICVTLAQVAFPGSKGIPIIAPVEQTCPRALHACITLTQAQDAQIAQLKQDKDQLAKALTDANKTPLLPTWAWAALGVLAGTVIGSKIVR